MAATKVYLNMSGEPIQLKEYGQLEIASGEHVSVTTDYHQPVILENYPGLIDVTDAQLDIAEDGSVTVRTEVPSEQV